MKSIRHLLKAIALVLVILISAEASPQKADDRRDHLLQERTYLGQSLTFWLQMLRDRNEDTISLAFDAVRSLGSDGWIAVPELARLVGAPFAPIDVVKDSRESIVSKVYDIAVRTEAINVLDAMGESASPATVVLIRWALMPRIVLGKGRTTDQDDLFIELVVMDADQRMRVAAAIAEFGRPAFPAVAALLTSSDASSRKLGVAILNQQALSVAGDLLRSEACDDRSVGFAIFEDLDLIVSRSFIDELRNRVCLIRTD